MDPTCTGGGFGGRRQRVREESSGIGVGSPLGVGVRDIDDGGCPTGDGICGKEGRKRRH